MILTIRQINEYGNYMQSIGKPRDAKYPHALVLQMMTNDLIEMDFDIKIPKNKQFYLAVMKAMNDSASTFVPTNAILLSEIAMACAQERFLSTVYTTLFFNTKSALILSIGSPFELNFDVYWYTVKLPKDFHS